MFAKHGIKNTLRTWRKSLIFFLLIALLVVLLGAALGLTVTVTDALRQCRDNYTTIGVVEYTGGGYPDLSLLDSEVGQAAESFDFASLAAHEAVLEWDEERTAFGYLPEAENALNVSDVRDNAVLLLKVRKYRESEGLYSSFVVQELFSTQHLDDSLINLMISDEVLQEDHYYLVNGSLHEGTTSNRYFIPTPYETAATKQAGVQSGVETGMLDVTNAEGGYTIPEDSIFYDIAETYRKQSRSVTVCAPKNIEAYLPFQQATLGLIEGRMFTQEEAHSGAAVCLLPQNIAEALNKHVGDTLELYIATAANSPLRESYWAGADFQLKQTYNIVGIVSRNMEWNYTVFIPPTEQVDMTVNHASYTLGQLRLDNDLAQVFAAQTETLLPDRVRVTIYDQGYAAVSAPLKDMQRIALILSAVCVLAGIAFLVLYGYLLVYRQRKTGRIMLRVGASKRNVYTYFLFGTGLIALPACLIGGIVSAQLSDTLIRLVNRTIANTSGMDLRYSNTNISMRKELSALTGGAGWNVFFLIAAAVFLLALLSCLFFTALSIRKRRKHRTFRGFKRGAKSHDLSGGALKYAFLSIKRGGFRSLIPVLAAACAAVLFLQLTNTTVNYQEQLQELRTESSVRGYFSDFRGQRVNGVNIPFNIVREVAEMEYISDVTLTVDFHYRFVSKHAEDEPFDAEIEELQGFSGETTFAQIKKGPSLVLTNGLEDVPDFLYSTSIQTEFLEGFDASFLSEDQSWTGGLPCVLPDTMMEACDIKLGDVFRIEYLHPQAQNLLFPLFLRAVGSYAKEEGKDNIYVPLSLMISPEALYGTPTAKERQWLNYCTLDSAIFRIDNCEHLAAVKQTFAEHGFSEINQAGSIRAFAIIEDAAYMATEKSVSQRLWYMERIFPAVYALLEALALFLAYMQIQVRKKELRIMRSVGTSAGTAFMSLYLEQVFLCLLGTGLGIGICALTGRLDQTGTLLTLTFALLWMLGALVSALSANGKRLLKHRREGE